MQIIEEHVSLLNLGEPHDKDKLRIDKFDLISKEKSEHMRLENTTYQYIKGCGMFLGLDTFKPFAISKFK